MEKNTAKRNPVNKPKDKKQTLITVLVCVGAAALILLCLWFFWLRGLMAASSATPAYVNSVASIAGMSGSVDTRYAGLVEPQEVLKVNKDESRTVAEVMVKEGDPVSIGTPLFRYDTQEMELTIRQAELELEGIANQLSTLQASKKTLEEEKAKASSDEQFNYTVQIQSTDLSIKEQEINRSTKQAELDKLKSNQQNSDVLSEAEGVVQEINLTPQTDPSTGQQKPFMSILSSGEYRVKGTLSEQNMGSLFVGQQVVVRSRVDENTTWTGSVESIGSDPVQDNNAMYYGYGSDSGQQSSKYNFYVALTSLDGLMLGQHVYIEPDLGVSSTRTGMWLPAVYVVSDDKGSYVWARDEKEKLEKRTIMLGDYDREEDIYQIVDGLTPRDYIAYPNANLVEGGPTTTDANVQFDPNEDYSDPAIDSDDPNAGIDTLPGGEDMMPIPEGGEDGVLPEGGAESVPVDDSLYEDGLGDTSNPDSEEVLTQ